MSRLWTLMPIMLCLIVGCSKGNKQSTQNNDGTHLSRAQAKALFPSTLGSFALAQYKVKKKSTDWYEYKAEYMRGSQVLKLVINDHLPDGNPDWEAKLAAGVDTIGEHSALTEVKGNKVTVMFSPHKRVRVDFKSRNMSGSQLRDAAMEYDLALLSRFGN